MNGKSLAGGQGVAQNPDWLMALRPWLSGATQQPQTPQAQPQQFGSYVPNSTMKPQNYWQGNEFVSPQFNLPQFDPKAKPAPAPFGYSSGANFYNLQGAAQSPAMAAAAQAQAQQQAAAPVAQATSANSLLTPEEWDALQNNSKSYLGSIARNKIMAFEDNQYNPTGR